MDNLTAKVQADLARMDGKPKPNIKLELCPTCGKKEAIVKRVKKQNENYDRPFLSCKCGAFFWLDLGVCRCGCPLSEFVVKKPGRNQGRKFRCCQRECRGAFTWLS